jgi:hypothetical protein
LKSHVELLEPRQLADFRWQRFELVAVSLLGARDIGEKLTIQLSRVPHYDFLEIAQQTELGRKRLELIAANLEST